MRGYRGSELSAADLVDTLWNMLVNEADVAGPIITGLADLFVSEKRSQLLSAWQDLRVEVGPISTLPGESSLTRFSSKISSHPWRRSARPSTACPPRRTTRTVR